MKFSLNWLREFVDTKNLDPQKIGDSLSLHTCELEEVIRVADNFNRVFAGKLLSVSVHKNSDKLHVGMI
jgi:phenylalanyl-tRNA synthetase beta chain